MRVCFIGNLGAIHSQRKVLALIERGLEVTAITNAPTDFTGVESVFLDNFDSFLELWKEQRGLIKKSLPDVIYANFIDRFTVVSPFLGVPTVFTPWGSDLYAPFPERFSGIRKFLKWSFLRQAYRRAKVVTSTGPHVTEMLETKFGVQPKRIFSFRLSLGEIPKVTETKIHETRNHYGAARGTTVFFCARACSPIYRTLECVAAFLEALKVGEDIQLWVSTFGADQEYLKEIKKISEHSQGRVVLLPPVSHEEFFNYIGAADAILSLPEWDGGFPPVTVAQALALGRPLICAEHPSVSEFINHGEQGLLLKNVDQQGLAKAIIDLHRNSSVRNQMSAKARDSYSKLPSSAAEFEKKKKKLIEISALKD